MHIRNSHGAQSSNTCNDCNKSFVSNKELENHKVTHHSSEYMIAINHQYFEKLKSEKENILKENKRLKEDFERLHGIYEATKNSSKNKNMK